MATPRDPEKSPAAFLGDELRRARTAAGFSSQDALATRLGFDRTVITKTETGDRLPTLDVLRAWCDACQLDSEMFGRLARLARNADGAVPVWYRGWIEIEREAHSLRLWAPLLMPGLLQTADYARALFLAAGFSEDQAAELTDARLERQSILDRQDPSQITAVVDETALHRLIGSPVTMSAQLDHLTAVSDLVNVSLHILPATGANAGLSGAFSIASTDGSSDTVVVESLEDQVTQDRTLVRRAAVVFDLVRREALPHRQSRDLIMEASNKWKTS